MIQAIEFVVPGVPAVKKRPRLGRNGNIYTPRATSSFEDTVRAHWLRASVRAGWRPRVGETYAVTIRLFYPDRHPRDVDNGGKAVLDSLNHVAFTDDRLVDELHVYKSVDAARPRVEIRVERKPSAGT